MSKIRLIWQCKKCQDIVISYNFLRHDMNTCECRKSAVDFEEDYMGVVGEIKELSRKESIKGEWMSIK